MKCWFINTSYKDYLGYHPPYMTSNFGNLVWNDGCRAGIRYDNQVFLEDIPQIHYSPDDIFILPVANNFSPGETVFSEKFRSVLSINARVVLIGVGIQDESIELSDFSAYVGRISEGKKAFFRKLSKQCVSIGVRGKYTARCLAEIGVNNTKVIGCPSFYSNLLTDNEGRVRPFEDGPLLFNLTDPKKEKSIVNILQRSKHKYVQISQQEKDKMGGGIGLESDKYGRNLSSRRQRFI